MVRHNLNIPSEQIAGLCRRYGIQRLWLFGSALRSDFRADSDVDVLIETDPANAPGLLALGGLQMDLTDLLGRSVDITMLGGVPVGARATLLAKARLQYAA